MTIRPQAKLCVLQHISLTAIKCEYYKLAISHYNMDTEVPFLNMVQMADQQLRFNLNLMSISSVRKLRNLIIYGVR